MDNATPFQVHADALAHYDPSHLNQQISDDQDFDAAVPPPLTTYIPHGTGNIAPNKSAAAQLPDLERKMAQQQTKFATVHLAKGYDGTKEATTRLFAELEECAAAVTTRASPHTIAKRTLVMAWWNLQSIVPKSKFNKQIKARTLSNLCTIFIVIISNYTIEPSTLKRAGQALLTKYGYYNYLRDQVVHSRGSTQGPTHAKWRELGFFIKLKHVRVFRKGENTWSVMVYFREFKCAIGTATGDEQTHVLEGVCHPHNILFDPTVVLIAHLFLRNAFAKKYESITDLCKDDSVEFLIDEDMKDEPLFLASEPGGRSFSVPHRAAMAHSVSDSSSHWLEQASLPTSGVTAWRRDAGNMYALQLGESIAKDLMNHVTTGVFRASYSRNTNNISTVSIRVAGTKETRPVSGRDEQKAAESNFMKKTAFQLHLENRRRGSNPQLPPATFF
ncbi:uncharacterized protein LACBIDRAFT_332594, partial [Laccaria bicolor S238N-H82]